MEKTTGKRKERDTESLDQNKGARRDEYTMPGQLGSPTAAAHTENVHLDGIVGLDNKTSSIRQDNKTSSIRQDILAQLNALGTQIRTVAQTERDTVTDMTSKFNQLKEEFDAAFETALDNAITTLNLSEQTAQAEEAERMMSEEAKLQRARQARHNFLENMKNITDRMTMELTVGQQAAMFQYIETQIQKRLEKEHETRKEQEPNQLARLSEVSSIALSYTLQQLSVTITNVYNTGPKLATQLIAVLTSAAMVYNYLPETMRGLYESIPYFGPIFVIMNKINPEAVLVQNSIATVTTIFYLLRNAGMDQTESIAALGAMTREAIGLCAREGTRLVCNAASMAAANTAMIGSQLQTASQAVLSKIADRLGYLLTSEYQQQETFVEDSQPSFSSLNNNTVASARDVSINASINTEATRLSIQSTGLMLDTPVTEGGIDFVGTAIPATVVDDRINIVASPIETADTAMPVAEVEQYFDSQETAHSDMSDLSTDSSGIFAPWFWPTRGGKRMKRSRRNMKSKRTRKGRKGRKKHFTKKGRKHHRTLKRYRAKMRR